MIKREGNVKGFKIFWEKCDLTEVFLEKRRKMPENALILFGNTL
jgi:hypothetical protein